MLKKPNLSQTTRNSVIGNSRTDAEGQFIDAKTGRSVQGNHYLHRAYIRKATRAEVEARAEKNEEGQFLDCHTHEPIEGSYDLGHKTGMEFRTMRAEAEAQNMTQAEYTIGIVRVKYAGRR